MVADARESPVRRIGGGEWAMGEGTIRGGPVPIGTPWVPIGTQPRRDGLRVGRCRGTPAGLLPTQQPFGGDGR
jgi:hypothetical protein